MSADIMRELEIKARANPKRVALPESGEEMVLRAAQRLVEMGVGYPVLVGQEQEVRALAEQVGVSLEGVEIIDNLDAGYVAGIASRMSAEGSMFSEKALTRKAKDPVNFAMMLLKLGLVDCVGAGRTYTTGDVILSAQTLVGLKPGISVVSSVGIVDAPYYDGPEGKMLCIGDCAINAQPTAEELADIAISSADTAAALLGWEPRVAFLSFSTKGSTEHESVDKVIKAVAIAKQRRPDLKLDGEFQFDAAVKPAVAARKVKEPSYVAGRANVLIFPDLNAGNIGVKLIQTFGGANAYGPVIQGFAKPVCDFSRGAPLEEMLGNLIMLLVRAQA